MRGSPLVRAVLAFVAILILGWPLRELTGDARLTTPPPAAATPVPATEVELQLTFTVAPTAIRVLHLGKEVWSEADPQAEMVRKLPIPYPKDGVDLQFAADFPEGSPLAAMRARLTDPEGEMHEKSLWGAGRIDDVLSFP